MSIRFLIFSVCSGEAKNMFHMSSRLFFLWNTSSTMGIDLFWTSRQIRIIQCCPFLWLCASMLRWTYWKNFSFPNRWWWTWYDIHLAAYPLMSVFWSFALRPCWWRLVTLHELWDRLETSPPLLQHRFRCSFPQPPRHCCHHLRACCCCCCWFHACLRIILGAGLS